VAALTINYLRGREVAVALHLSLRNRADVWLLLESVVLAHECELSFAESVKAQFEKVLVTGRSRWRAIHGFFG
jgi:hypothetical protein